MYNLQILADILHERGWHAFAIRLFLPYNRAEKFQHDWINNEEINEYLEIHTGKEELDLIIRAYYDIFVTMKTDTQVQLEKVDSKPPNVMLAHTCQAIDEDGKACKNPSKHIYKFMVSGKEFFFTWLSVCDECKKRYI